MVLFVLHEKKQQAHTIWLVYIFFVNKCCFFRVYKMSLVFGVMNVCKRQAFKACLLYFLHMLKEVV